MKVDTLRLALLLTVFASTRPVAAQAIDPNAGLATLGRVWGLVKYHPGSARQSGADDRLLAAIPRVRVATAHAALNEEVVALLRSSGQAFAFREVTDISASVAPGPAVGWIDRDPNLAAATRVALKDIVLAHRGGLNNYVVASGASNPDFSGDAGSGATAPFPSEEIRLLALFRYWNMVQYYFPCADLIDRDWNDVLDEFVPVFRQASTALDYHLAVARLTALITDAHATTTSAVLESHWGTRIAPVRLRLVEGKSVVIRVYSTLSGSADLRVGDVITEVDGVPPDVRRASLRPYLSGSNEGSLERIIHSVMGKSSASSLSLARERDGNIARVILPTYDTTQFAPAIRAYDLENFKLFKLLEGNVGYVHMGLLQREDVATVMSQLRNTRAIVFDLRNYPNQTLYDVMNYLIPSALPFVKFTEPDYGRPGSLLSRGPFTAGPGASNTWAPALAPFFKYDGRVVVLIDQETISQSEYTAMAFKTVPGAILIGGPTAGADGNVSPITLPGGITTYFSGLGVFYPDGRPTQRVGIVPDQVVTPTIAGLRAGRDGALDAALQVLR